jgi:hypothetical protein
MGKQTRNVNFVPTLYLEGDPLNNDPAMLRLQRFKEISFMAERPFVTTDLLRFCLGDKIGEGAYRAVYEYQLRKGTVIKIAMDERANILEYQIWRACRKVPAYSKWLAPCLDISPCGHFLIQKRVRPLKDSDKLPALLPNFFDDIRRANWGYIGNRLVCHDYQFLERLVDLSFNAGKRDANWRK